MAEVTEIMQMCRLCLVKEQVNIPIFEDAGDVHDVLLKISACLPVKVSREDNLPKKVCDGCGYKLDLLYQFWNTATNAEKQLVEWLTAAGVDPKHNGTTEDLLGAATQPSIVLKQEPITDDLSADTQSYILQQQQIPVYQQKEEFKEYTPTATKASKKKTKSSPVVAEPSSKRPRRATRKRVVKESSEEEDDIAPPAEVTKTEGDSDADDDEMPDADFGTGDDEDNDTDQPGPSGVGKSSTTPLNDWTFAQCKLGYKLKECFVYLGDLEKFNHTKYRLGIKKTGKIQTEVDKDNILASPRHKYKCQECGLQFKDYATLESHRTTFHFFPEDASDQSSEDNYEPSSDNSSSTASEHEDSGTVSEQETNTITTSTPDENEVVAFPLKEPSLSTQAVLQCKCYCCDVVFQEPNYIKHANEKGFRQKCSRCVLRFALKSELMDHMAKEHSIFSCSLCEQTFFTKNNADMHIKTKHQSGIGKWKCSLCSLHFHEAGDLLEHNRVNHVIQCSLCKKSFKSLRDLIMHKKSFHKIPSHLLCDHCAVTSNTPAEMQAHRATHAPPTPVPIFKCNMCAFMFASSHGLQGHMNKYHGKSTAAAKSTAAKSSRVKCPLCNLTFSNSTDLSKHSQVHIKVHNSTSASQNVESKTVIKEKSNTSMQSNSSALQFRSSTSPQMMSCAAPPNSSAVPENMPNLNNVYVTAPQSQMISNDHNYIVVDNSKYLLLSTSNLNSNCQINLPVLSNVGVLTQPTFNPTILNGNLLTQPINNYMQPSINQTIVLPNSPSNSQLRITNNTSEANPQTIIEHTSNVQTAPSKSNPPSLSVNVDENLNKPKIYLKPLSQLLEKPSLNESSEAQGNQMLQTVVKSSGVNTSTSSLVVQSSLLPVESGQELTTTILNNISTPSSSVLSSWPAQPPTNQLSSEKVRKTFVGPKSMQTITIMNPTSLNRNIQPVTLVQQSTAPKSKQRLSTSEDVTSTPKVVNTTTLKQHPSSSKQQPSALKQQPSYSKQQPSSSMQQPSTLKQQPPLVKPQQSTSNQQPSISKQRPSTSKQIVRVLNTELDPTIANISSLSRPKVDNVVNQGKKLPSLTCHSCRIVFRNAKRLSLHHSKYKCELCEFKSCRLKVIDDHYQTAHNSHNRCSSCNIQFDSRKELVVHKRNEHLCTKCNRCYLDLKKHLQGYKCGDCSFVACSSQSLLSHYRAVHAVSRCGPCNQNFTSTAEFEEHKRSCHFCERCGCFKMNLSIHSSFCKGLKQLYNNYAATDDVIVVDDQNNS